MIIWFNKLWECNKTRPNFLRQTFTFSSKGNVNRSLKVTELPICSQQTVRNLLQRDILLLSYILDIKPDPCPLSKLVTTPLSHAYKCPFIPLFTSKVAHWHEKARLQCYQAVNK